MNTILQFEQVCVEARDRNHVVTPILQSVDLKVEMGERLGIVGGSGSGKSTLLRIAAGVLSPGLHLTSGAASLVPNKPAGEGGWGVAYAMAKGAAHRIAGVMHAEYSSQGFRAYSLNPGHVTTEVMSMRAQREGREVSGKGPEDVASATRWLIEGNAEAIALSGQEVVSRDVIQRLRNS